MTTYSLMTVKCDDCAAMCPSYDDADKQKQWIADHVGECGSGQYSDFLLSVDTDFDDLFIMSDDPTVDPRTREILHETIRGLRGVSDAIGWAIVKMGDAEPFEDIARSADAIANAIILRMGWENKPETNHSKEEEGLLEYVAGVLTHICSMTDGNGDEFDPKKLLDIVLKEADTAHRKLAEFYGW